MDGGVVASCGIAIANNERITSWIQGNSFIEQSWRWTSWLENHICFACVFQFEPVGVDEARAFNVNKEESEGSGNFQERRENVHDAFVIAVFNLVIHLSDSSQVGVSLSLLRW